MTRPLLILAVMFSLAAEVRPDELHAARALYDGVVSVRMQADLEVQRYGATGRGSFEYWADGDKYRMSCSTDRALGLMADVEHSFDGRESRFLEKGANLLVLRSGDVSQLPMALPNPFFLPVSYLEDTCYSCALKLHDLPAKRVNSVKSREDTPLTLRVSDQAIEWLRKGGSVYSRTSFDAADARGFPRHMVLTDLDEQGKETMRIDISIRVLELNTAIDPTTFEIPLTAASRVWDERGEPHRFVR